MVQKSHWTVAYPFLYLITHLLSMATMSVQLDYDWYLSQNLEQYAGLWIAIVNKAVVVKGKSLKEVLNATKSRYPDEEPFVTRVLPKGAIELL